MESEAIIRWQRIAFEEELIQELKKLPEGAQMPNFEESDTYIFLGVRGEGRKGRLILLTEAGLGNMYPEPLIEEYSLMEGAWVYNITQRPK